jgi:Na+-transporting methylmalonyl-CoA/oxaloacetate decarboxylase gamma subunit
MDAGLAISVLGMVIVFCFIALLALAISLLSRFKGKVAPVAVESRSELVAVIGAALHAHRSATGRVERREES